MLRVSGERNMEAVVGYIIWVAKELGLQIFIRDNG